MSTLTAKDHILMSDQIHNAEGMIVSKADVLKILHDKLKDIDAKNPMNIDRIDGAALKDLINDISKLK